MIERKMNTKKDAISSPSRFPPPLKIFRVQKINASIDVNVVHLKYGEFVGNNFEYLRRGVNNQTKVSSRPSYSTATSHSSETRIGAINQRIRKIMQFSGSWRNNRSPRAHYHLQSPMTRVALVKFTTYAEYFYDDDRQRMPATIDFQSTIRDKEASRRVWRFIRSLPRPRVVISSAALLREEDRLDWIPSRLYHRDERQEQKYKEAVASLQSRPSSPPARDSRKQMVKGRWI